MATQTPQESPLMQRASGDGGLYDDVGCQIFGAILGGEVSISTRGFHTDTSGQPSECPWVALGASYRGPDPRSGSLPGKGGPLTGGRTQF